MKNFYNLAKLSRRFSISTHQKVGEKHEEEFIR